MKEKNNASCIVVDYLIDIGSREIVFWTSPIQIYEVDIDSNSALFVFIGTMLDTHSVNGMG